MKKITICFLILSLHGMNIEMDLAGLNEIPDKQNSFQKIKIKKLELTAQQQVKKIKMLSALNKQLEKELSFQKKKEKIVLPVYVDQACIAVKEFKTTWV